MLATVRGESMRPFIKPLDQCIYTDLIKPLSIGDIVIYPREGRGYFSVHRVIGVDVRKGLTRVKGDNVTGRSDTVPFSEIRGKVLAVRRNNRETDLTSPSRRVSARFIAFLSRNDITPLVLKKKFLDPFLLFTAGTPVFSFFRRISYRKLSSRVSGQPGKTKVTVHVNGRQTAWALIERKKGLGKVVTSYIRYRDRNRFFAAYFLEKILEAGKSRFPGEESDVFITDDVLSSLSRGSARTGIRGLYLAGVSERLSRDLYPSLDFLDGRCSAGSRLLAALCAAGTREDRKSKIAAWEPSAFDWERAVRTAVRCNVAALLYHNISLLEVQLPGKLAEELRVRSAQVFAQNIRIMEEAKRLSAAFKRGGIEVLFLKGVAYAAEIYGGKGGREFSDIDIYVDAQASGRLEAFILSMGYRSLSDNASGYRSQKVYISEGNVVLDVHTGLSGRAVHDRLIWKDRSGLWRERRELHFDGVYFTVPGVIDTILYHCLHLGIQHSFRGLRWFVDLNELIEKHGGTLDWPKFLRLARTRGIRKPVYYCLYLVKKMFGTPVPDFVIEELSRVRSPFDLPVLRRIREINPDTDYLAELFMFDSLSDTANFILRSLCGQPFMFRHFVSVFFRLFRQLAGQTSKPIRG